MKKLLAVIAALLIFVVASPANATVYKFRAPAQFTETLGVTGVITAAAKNSIAFSSSGCKIYNPAGTFYITLTPGAEAANRVLSFPVLGAADTIMTLGTAQTVSGVKTFSAAPLFNSAVGATFKGTSYDATIIALAGLGQASTITIPDPGAAAAKMLLTTGTATACASTTAQLDTYTVCVDMADAGTAQSVFVVCPWAGTIQSMYAVNAAANTTTKTVFTAEIGGTLVGTVAAWEQGVTDAVGTVTTAVCNATNTVTAGQALEIITDGGSATANQKTNFVITIKR
jgi:hypothetical protein